jgi:hypothetical protein
MPLNNFTLQINPMVEPEIKPGTFWSVGNGASPKPYDRTADHICYLKFDAE